MSDYERYPDPNVMSGPSDSSYSGGRVPRNQNPMYQSGAPVPPGRRSSAVSRKRKRRQRIIRRISALLIVIILLGLLGLAAYFFLPGLIEKLSAKSSLETFTQQIDITDEVAGNIALWLSDLEGENIDSARVREHCDKISVRSRLILDKDSDGKKIYSEVIDEESYEETKASVDNILNELLTEVIADRLVKSGYADSLTKEEAAGVANQVLGMNISDYIREQGVTFIPSLEELNNTRTLGSGSYSLEKGVITFNSSEGTTLSEPVISKKDSLVLLDSARVYTKEGEKNE